MRYRVSPSLLETFRLYCTGAYWGAIDFDNVVSSIKREDKPSDKARLGTAAHRLLEYGVEPFYDKARQVYVVPVGYGNPVIFRQHEVSAFCEYRKQYPHISCERWAKLEFNGIFGKDCVMNMRLDAIEGVTVHDHKLKVVDYKSVYTALSRLDVSVYEDSLQWRAYLAATGAKRFQYNLFLFSVKDVSATECLWEPIQLYPTKDMYEELRSWLSRFVGFCKSHSLEKYITIK